MLYYNFDKFKIKIIVYKINIICHATTVACVITLLLIISFSLLNVSSYNISQNYSSIIIYYILLLFLCFFNYYQYEGEPQVEDSWAISSSRSTLDVAIAGEKQKIQFHP